MKSLLRILLLGFLGNQIALAEHGAFRGLFGVNQQGQQGQQGQGQAQQGQTGTGGTGGGGMGGGQGAQYQMRTNLKDFSVKSTLDDSKKELEKIQQRDEKQNKALQSWFDKANSQEPAVDNKTLDKVSQQVQAYSDNIAKEPTSISDAAVKAVNDTQASILAASDLSAQGVAAQKQLSTPKINQSASQASTTTIGDKILQFHKQGGAGGSPQNPLANAQGAINPNAGVPSINGNNVASNSTMSPSGKTSIPGTIPSGGGRSHGFTSNPPSDPSGRLLQNIYNADRY